jgi:hypothetical protein
MKFKPMSWKEAWQCYPRTLCYIPYVLFFGIMYLVWHNPMALLFIGFGLGCLMSHYSCETYHNAANRKKMMDETLEAIKKDHIAQVHKLIKQMEQMHTQSVIDEADRIRKQS